MDLGTVQPVDIDAQVQQSYLDYAMSVIVARALPDARDGLKPVQRRILYAMHDMNMHPGGDFKKSARIVGEVLGKYHPHGDLAVYEAMARMAQDFSLRYPLIEGQGNFGSVDGDEPAAMRYTEARLAPLAPSLLADLEKETVPYGPNFDGTLREPQVLPSAAPNLLINGATGIAVGMATSIPPHNLGEVCEALIFLLRSWTRTKEITTDDLLRFIKGPDFPTGGLILDRPGQEEGLSAAYGSGRGKITVRARAHWEEAGKGRGRIVVTELPYQVNKAALLERIAELARQGSVEGIADLRDESDRQGMRVVIELSRSADAEGVLKKLYRHTPMETTFSIILLALVQGEPRLLNLKQALRVFLDHRLEVIQKRSAYELARAHERMLILQGLRIALRNLEEVVRLIRSAPTAAEAKERLQKRFRLTALQAEAILDMPLRKLAALEREKIETEYKEKVALIEALEKLLASPKLQREALIEELRQLEQRFADPRRTAILSDGEKIRSLLTAAPERRSAEAVWVTLTETGQLARTGSSRQPLPVPQAPLRAALRASTRDALCLLTADGRLAALAVDSLPEAETRASGAHFATLCGLEAASEVVSAVSVPPPGKAREATLALFTRRGMAKRVRARDLPRPSAAPAAVLKLGAGDELGWAAVTDGKQELVLLTQTGNSIRFREEAVRPMGLPAAGVAAVRLAGGSDRVVWAGAVPSRCDLLLVGEDGRAKRMPISELPRQARNGAGTKAWEAGAGNRLAGAAAGLAETRLLVCLRGAAPQPMKIEDFPRRKRTAEAARPAAFPKARKVTGLIPFGEANEGRRAPSAGRKTSRPAKVRGSGRTRGRTGTRSRSGGG